MPRRQRYSALNIFTLLLVILDVVILAEPETIRSQPIGLPVFIAWSQTYDAEFGTIMDAGTGVNATAVAVIFGRLCCNHAIATTEPAPPNWA